MSDFIRTSTERIRGAATGEQNVPVKPEQFDDWLAEHDREIQVQALESEARTDRYDRPCEDRLLDAADALRAARLTTTPAPEPEPEPSGFGTAVLTGEPERVRGFVSDSGFFWSPDVQSPLSGREFTDFRPLVMIDPAAVDWRGLQSQMSVLVVGAEPFKRAGEILYVVRRELGIEEPTDE